MEKVILTATEKAILSVTLNRPRALNALNSELEAELDQAIDNGLANEEIRAIVISGSGKAFAAGKDISEFVGKGGEGMAAISRNDHRIVNKILNSPKPVIAAINGMAFGGGLELAMACHIRVASSKAILGQPEVSLGAIPGAGGTQLLPRLIGRGAALYYLLTGEDISVQDGYRLGLIDMIVPPERLMVTSFAIAKVVSQKGPIAVRLILDAVKRGMELPLEEALDLEEELWRTCGETEDFNLAIKAFMEKKPVVFKGK